MRHNKKFNHLSRTADHRHAMLANMTISLIMHKRITTTLAKAKALKKYAEPLINRSKDDSTHSRRVVFSYLQNKEALMATPVSSSSATVSVTPLRSASSNLLTSTTTWPRLPRLARRPAAAASLPKLRLPSLRLLRLLRQRQSKRMILITVNKNPDLRAWIFFVFCENRFPI